MPNVLALQTRLRQPIPTWQEASLKLREVLHRSCKIACPRTKKGSSLFSHEQGNSPTLFLTSSNLSNILCISDAATRRRWQWSELIQLQKHSVSRVSSSASRFHSRDMFNAHSSTTSSHRAQQCACEEVPCGKSVLDWIHKNEWSQQLFQPQSLLLHCFVVVWCKDFCNAQEAINSQ